MGAFSVIGVGNFGFHLARTLYELGHEVVVVDNDRSRLQRAQEFASYGLLADAADKDFLEKQGFAERDAVVVATGERSHLATLITLYLKEIGCRQIVVKAIDDDHGKILRKIGAGEVIYPEKDMAVKTARSLASPNIIDYLPMVDDYSLSEVAAPAGFIGKSLVELDLRQRFGILVIGVKDVITDQFNLLPDAHYVIKDSDLLIVLGKIDDLSRATR